MCVVCRLQTCYPQTFGCDSYRPVFSTNRLLVHFVPRASATVAVLDACASARMRGRRGALWCRSARALAVAEGTVSICCMCTVVSDRTQEFRCALPPARITSPEAPPTIPTGTVYCLCSHLASFQHRSFQTNRAFQLVCIRGDKCTFVKHHWWVRVRRGVSNIEKPCDERTQRSTARHFH